MHNIKKIWYLLLLTIVSLGYNSAQGQTTDAREGISPAISANTIYYFEVVPDNTSGETIDALFTLSEGPITSYTDCSTILRFNNIQAQPYLDVHSGTYVRTNNVAIEFGQTYQCWFDIDFSNQTYSTYVQTNGMDNPTLIHADAQFRKKDITSFNFWSAIHNSANSPNQLLVTQTAIVNSVGELPPDFYVLSSAYGTIDQDNLTISNLDPVSIADFLSGIEISNSATAEIIDESGNTINSASTDLITSQMKLRITGTQISEYQLQVREISSDNQLYYVFGADIDHASSYVFNLYNDITYYRFITGLEVSEYATFKVLDKSSETINDPETLIETNFKIEVTAEDGSVKTYTTITTDKAQPAKVISDSKRVFFNLDQEKYDLEGAAEIHILTKENPFAGTLLNIKSEDAWIYFDHIRPQVVNDLYLQNIQVYGQPVLVGENVRLVQFGNGSVIIGHSKDYKPLTIYTDANLSGESMELEVHTHYKTLDLDDFNNNVESFVLKKGYMASFSDKTNGTGSSKIYIANKEDIVVNTMPEGLFNTTSFIRVVPWRWVNKKGYVGSPGHGDWAAQASWTYSHGNPSGEQSTLNTEFVPLKHNPNWPGYYGIQNNENYTHALYYNEPDNSVDDGFSSVEDAIAAYPNMLASGLRMVSPAPTDGGVGWLVDFVNQCKANNYRLDAVAIHFYRGGQTTQQFYNFLADVHNRTGLPVWVTEWNNGCNWTCCLPSYESQGETIEAWTTMLENAPFVERYVLWAGCNPERSYFYGDGTRTPGGWAYYNHPTSFAYSGDREIDVNFNYPEHLAKEISREPTLAWNTRSGAISQQLYFGDSYPPPLHANLDAGVDSYEIDQLEFNKTYYWRIDTYVDGQFQTGEELEFSTVEYQKASNPYPANGAVDVERDLILTWQSDSTKEELHKLYLGTHPDSMVLESTFLDDFTSFDRASLIGSLEPSTTYYWKVDEHIVLKDGSEFVNSGEVWSFTTTEAILSSPALQTLEIYPNPVENILMLKNVQPGSRVDVLNILGQIVYSDLSKPAIDVSSWSPGVYFLKVNGFKTLKIIKE